MRALVTGATGFVGAAVARALLREGWQVRALVRAGADRRNLQGLEIETVPGDLIESASLARAAAGCLAVFHVAADYRLGARDPRELYRTNVEGTRNVLAAALAAGVQRLVYTSSVATHRHTRRRHPGERDDAGGAERHDRPLQALQVPGRGGGAGGRTRRRLRW